MRRLWKLNVFWCYITSCTSQSGDCGERLHSGNTCCVNFYMDPDLKTCLPCNGSYGHNCSSPCPDGFYGPGCRLKCECGTNQFCDPKKGCFLWNDHKDEVKFSLAVHFMLPLTSIGVLTITTLVVVYGMRKYRRMKTSHKYNVLYTGVRESQIVSSICTSLKSSMLQDITTDYKRMCGKYNSHRALAGGDHEQLYEEPVQQQQDQVNVIVQATTKPMLLLQGELRSSRLGVQQHDQQRHQSKRLAVLPFDVIDQAARSAPPKPMRAHQEEMTGAKKNAKEILYNFTAEETHCVQAQTPNRKPEHEIDYLYNTVKKVRH